MNFIFSNMIGIVRGNGNEAMDPRFVIRPYKGVGPIDFGMSRGQIRSLMPDVPKSFFKSYMSEMETDAFDQLGIHVSFNSSGRCEAIEFMRAAQPIFEGMTLLGNSFSESAAFLRKLDPDVEIDDTGLTSYAFGIGLYSPDHKEDSNAPVESVIIFERGYYDT